MRQSGRPRSLTVVAAMLLVAGCSMSSSPTPPPDGFSPSPTSTASTLTVAHDAAFELTARVDVPAAGFKSGDSIPIHTTYRFLGPEASLIAGSVFPSLVYFSLEELDGPLDQAGGASRLMCDSVSLARDVLVDVPFQKTGAYSGTDPNASFWDGYFRRPSAAVADRTVAHHR